MTKRTRTKTINGSPMLHLRLLHFPESFFTLFRGKTLRRPRWQLSLCMKVSWQPSPPRNEQ